MEWHTVTEQSLVHEGGVWNGTLAEQSHWYVREVYGMAHCN